MYKGSAALDKAINKMGGRTFRARVTLSSGEVIDDIMNLVHYGGSNMSDDIAIGTTVMSSVEMSFTTDKATISGELNVEAGVLTENGYEYVPMGAYTVQKCTKEGNYITLTVVDRMSRTNKLYVSELNYPASIDAVIAEIATICGISAVEIPSNNMTIDSKPQGYTCREMLGYIAARLGKFAIFNRYGKLEFQWYSSTPITKELDVFYMLEYNSHYTINKVTFNKDVETTYTYGHGVGVINNNPICQEVDAKKVYDSIGGFEYDVAVAELLGDIRLDPWDAIAVTYFNGEVYNIPCMSLTTIITGGCITSVTSVGKTDVEAEYGYDGPVMKSLDRAYKELLTTNKLVADEAEIIRATVENLNTAKARIDDLETDTASINTLMFGSATGTELTTQFANAVIAVLGDAQITDAMIKNVSAGKINAGTIYTNLISIYGDESKRLSLVDNTIQIRDENDIVRVQLGEDATGDYNLQIWNAEGKIIFNTNGVTENGYNKGSIKDLAIAKNANISGSKINISSLYEAMNNDGTSTLNATKVYLDDKNQNLEVAFNSLGDTVGNQGTQINVQQGQIQTLVWQTNIDNLIPFPYDAKSGEFNGLSVTIEDDGGITATGTPTANVFIGLQYRNIEDTTILRLEKGKTYTLSGATLEDWQQKGMRMYMNNISNTKFLLRTDTALGATFTADEDYDKCGLILNFSAGKTYNDTIYPMLNYGSVAQSYRPYKESQAFYRSEITQTKDKIDLLVADGSSSSELNITPQGIKAITNQLEVTGDMIVDGAITADKIATGSITANQMTIGDYTNYITVDANNPATMLPTSFFGGTAIREFPDAPGVNSVVKPNVSNRYLMFCGYTPFNFGINETLYIDASIPNFGSTDCNRAIIMYMYDANKNFIDVLASPVVYFKAYTWNLVKAQITITADAILKNPKYFAIGIDCANYNLGIKVGSSIRRKIKGSLIVDGSITADKINTKDLFAQDITATGTITGLKLKATTVEVGANSTIGGFTVWGDSINNGEALTNTKVGNSTGMGTQGGNWAFWAGNGRFSVQQNGAAYCSNLTAEGGKIGGVTINKDDLSTGYITIGNGSIIINNLTPEASKGAKSVKIGEWGFEFYSENNTGGHSIRLITWGALMNNN